MEYKPDERILVGYLYGELDEADRKKVDQYLSNHPEEQERLKELADARSVLTSLADKEVIVPPVFFDEPRTSVFWEWANFKLPIGIAASFFVILLIGKLLGTEINYSQGELNVRFSSPTETTSSAGNLYLTKADLNELISESLDSNNKVLETTWSETREELNEIIRESVGQDSEQIEKLVRIASTASENQVREYVSDLHTENLQLVENYLSLSVNDQREYMESLLIDFAGYLQAQRELELSQIQTRVSSIEANTSQLKEETEQILAGIISNSVKTTGINY